MHDLDLSGRELGVLRALMAMEPAPGQPLPEPVVLEKIDALAYRKFGVTNRMAAIARLRGSEEPGLDPVERVQRYA